MKLQQRLRHEGQGLGDFLLAGIDEKQYRCHEGRQPPGQLGRATGAHMAGAWGIQHEAQGIDPSGYRCIDIGLSGQAADLDAGAGDAHGSQS